MLLRKYSLVALHTAASKLERRLHCQVKTTTVYRKKASGLSSNHVRKVLLCPEGLLPNLSKLIACVTTNLCLEMFLRKATCAKSEARRPVNSSKGKRS